MRDFVTLCSFIGITSGTVAREFDQIRDKYVLRRTKDKTTMSFENVELDMYPEERDLYIDAFLAGQGFIRDHGSNANTMEMLECLLRIRQVMVWPQTYIDGMAQKNKTDPVRYTGRSKKHETLFGMLQTHPDEKALVFTQFTTETDRLQEFLTFHGFPVFRLDGSVSTEDRVERIEKFKRGPPNSIFLIQIRAGGVGLNLQEASRVYIMSPAWNPATELQAIGRSHRTGQTRHVIIKKFMYKDISDKIPSVEEAVIHLQMSKSKVCAEVLGDERLENQVPGIVRLHRRTIAKIFKV
jgi:SNF2 family DNA or RNA helicase